MGKLPLDVRRLLAGRVTLITFVTLAELTRWVEQRQGDAPTWGAITAHAYLRGRPRPANDSWIAACCLAYDLPLVTRNVKDFEDFAEYEGLRIPVAS